MQFQINQPHRPDSAGIFSFSEPRVHAARLLPYHVLLYLEYGAWDIEYAGRRLSFQAGDVTVLPAHIRHCGVSPCTAGTRGIFLHYLPNKADALLPADMGGEEHIRISAVTHTTDGSHIQELFLQILNQYRLACPYSRSLCGSLFDTLLLTLHEQQEQGGHLRRRIDALLHEHMERFLTNAEFAAAFNLSVKALERRFRSETGQTLHGYQLSYKLESARSLLRADSEITLYEAACMLGFHDAAHLSHRFKERFGVPPRAAQDKSAKAL